MAIKITQDPEWADSRDESIEHFFKILHRIAYNPDFKTQAIINNDERKLFRSIIKRSKLERSRNKEPDPKPFDFILKAAENAKSQVLDHRISATKRLEIMDFVDDLYKIIIRYHVLFGKSKIGD